jgi:hypothetical protein
VVGRGKMATLLHKVWVFTFLQSHDLNLFRENVHELLDPYALDHGPNLHPANHVHLHYLCAIAVQQCNPILSIQPRNSLCTQRILLKRVLAMTNYPDHSHGLKD